MYHQAICVVDDVWFLGVGRFQIWKPPLCLLCSFITPAVYVFRMGRGSRGQGKIESVVLKSSHTERLSSGRQPEPDQHHEIIKQV